MFASCEHMISNSTIDKYKRGSTMLLRHSLPPTTSEDSAGDQPICITKHSERVRERVAGRDFEFNAGSFFQNNNGILEALVNYVSAELVPRADDAAPRFLVDAYCGSGLFAISLANAFTEVQGVEISSDSVKWAKHNAELNNVNNATFITGNAEAIFEVSHACCSPRKVLAVRR